MSNPRVGPPVRPAVLAKVPRAVLRALDVDDVLRDALNAGKHPTIYGPIIALHALGSYFEAARRQQRRIKKARASALRSSRSIFDDVHFYLICWTRIAKLARFITQATRFRRTGLVLRRYRSELDDRITGRDHLEHFEERLPGGPKRKKMREPTDLFNMVHDHMTFGGQRINVGPGSIQLLKEIVGEFRVALLFDAVESLANKDMNRLTLLMRKAVSTVHVRRVTREAQKMLRGASQDISS